MADDWPAKSRSASHGTALSGLNQNDQFRSSLKGFSAAATLLRVRVGDFESAAGQRIAEIHDRAAQIIDTGRIMTIKLFDTAISILPEIILAYH